MVTYKEIDCLKCEKFIKPEDRNCAECSRVSNEHQEELIIDELSTFSKEALITKLYNRMTTMEKILMAEYSEKKNGQ